MEDQLLLEIVPDPDGTAELFATVQAGPFSGHSSAWIDPEELVSFGRALAETFPLTTTLGISGGYWSDTSPGTLSEEHLSISFYPIGNRGQIGCQVRLASLQFASERPQSRRAVQVELEVTYAELQRFGPALVELASGLVAEAVLHVVSHRE
jgi:hypothetical protein